MKHSPWMVFNKNVMSSIASSSNIISIIIELDHSYRQWIITFCKWILAESPPFILSNVLFLPFSFSAFWKEPIFFLAISCPSVPAMLNYTFKTLRRWLQKPRPAPSKSNLSQAPKLNWINSQIALFLFSYWLLCFSPFLIVWLCPSLKLYPASLGWWSLSFWFPITKFDYSLFLASFDKTDIQLCFDFLSPNSS